MKYSVTYLLYPDNKALEKALEYFIGKLSDPDPEDIKPDTMVTVPDNFSHTRGNYEQHLYRGTLLDPARDLIEQDLTEEFRQQAPLEWAQTQNHFGNILAAQGQQLRDEALYGKAIDAFNSALEVLDQEAEPSKWAATQYNLGTASQAAGRQLRDSKLLKQAVDAYTNALLVWTREQTPEEWASTMHQLGATLHAHGLLLKGNRTFQKSAVAYNNALAVLDADNHAFELTAAYNNRAVVLHHLAESEQNPERLKEAVKSYDKAITVSMEQQLPFHLPVICRVNKATAQNVLAELTKDTVLAEEMADEFELIIECFPHALQPLCLKHCEEQMNKAKSLAVASSA